MVHRCPVCKARLWSDSFFAMRLNCPRCEAEFKPTVPLIYFRSMFLLVVVLTLTIIFLADFRLWIAVGVAAAVFIFFWQLPKLIDLQQVGDLTVAEGPIEADSMQMKLNYKKWNRENEEDESLQPRGSRFFFLLFFLAIVVFLLILAQLSP